MTDKIPVDRELLERISWELNNLEWLKFKGYETCSVAQEVRAALSEPVQQQEPVAYLDVGAGYLDMGSDLPEETLAALPWGRHMLAIVGTYGADGYVPAHPAPADALDAARYRWLRERLQLRFMEAVSGIKKEGITTRIGHCFLDADRIPGSGYLDQSKFQAECTALDAAIDAALAAAKGEK